MLDQEILKMDDNCLKNFLRSSRNEPEQARANCERQGLIDSSQLRLMPSQARHNK